MSELPLLDDAAFARLAHAALDGEISADDSAHLSDAIARDPARAAEFARLAMLHDALEREMNAAAAGRAVARRTQALARFRRVAAIAAALVVAAFLGWFSLRTTPEASASEIVARLVASVKSGDRAYFLRAVGASHAAPVVTRRACASSAHARARRATQCARSRRAASCRSRACASALRSRA